VQPLRVIVGVTGGAAAIKAPSLLRRLREAGHEVRVAATDDAYRFVTPLSLSLAADGRVFDREYWFEPGGKSLHLEWASWAHLLLVAPATADSLARAAGGHGNDVISSLVLAGVHTAWSPAMNPRMWQSPAVRRNIELLREYGHRIVQPASGAMAAVHEEAGEGRMPEPEELVQMVPGFLRGEDLRGKRVLVSAGPTREYIDPVRYISNPSSGKQGFAVALAAAQRGARVTLVAGPTGLPAPSGVEVIRVETAAQMLEALDERFDACDILVMSAAVADWRPKSPASEKVPKGGYASTVELEATVDILESLGRRRRPGQVLVGFAMETHAGPERAAQKVQRKRLDFIGLNYPTKAGTGFGSDENEVTIVSGDGHAEALPRSSKLDIAHALLDRAVRLLG